MNAQDAYNVWSWRRYDWRRIPTAVREGLLLQALGDRRLGLGELERAVEQELFGNVLGGGAVRVTALARRMLDAGELDREFERTQRTHHYVYFRRRAGAAIAELERIYCG